MIYINYKKLNNIFITKIEGELSIRTIDQFDKILQIQFDHKPETVAINCQKVNYIDSTGINHLFNLSQKAADKKIKIIYLDLPDDINRLFQLTYLDKLCNISSSKNFENEYLYEIA